MLRYNKHDCITIWIVQGGVNMRIILELLRFSLIFFALSTMIGIITQITFLATGIDPEKHGWISVIIVFILIFALYRNKGWGKVFNKKILWTTLISMILLAIFIPDVAPAHLHTDRYAYSYGFPFNFLTLHIENGTKLLIPNLFSGKFVSWSLSMGMLGNFVIFYFALSFIFKSITNKQMQSG